MRRLVFITQRVDPEHPVLWATVPKLRALAERVDELTVLALATAPSALPESCRVRAFGAPTRLLRGVRFEAALLPELVRRPPAAVLAHMSPVYARLAARPAHVRGARVLLWYTQWRTNPSLERAVRAVDAVLTVDRHSFPFASPKVRAIGHGIDTGRFRCAEPRPDARLRLLALGRYATVKGYPVLLRAVARVDAELDLYGSCETAADRRHRPELERLAGELGLDGRVRFHGPASPGDVPGLLAGADALVNVTGGGADKVVLEAAASCLPVLAAAEAFSGLLPDRLRFPADDPETLAERLRGLAALAPAERAELGRSLRGRVVAEHSVDTWADRVLAAAGL
jgi:glycosyltransferase involved in cell wall biosynthesis